LEEELSEELEEETEEIDDLFEASADNGDNVDESESDNLFSDDSL